ncbi:head-to-tail stopper [Mycobacterium phage Aroostook]|nr:head-to-tail stopper [Mycobacterium phage Gomashi]AKY02614.1 head-to-tail stopper [Mycobacterium phage Phreak]ALF01159.1 head-to-tail stopper [Mycobacterium phage Annihilator]AOT25692.1 head-to-tail stopper [Mycobacterium phage Zombie]AOT28076.1 head-to-tail stopper [Mycobacterium phage Jane]ASZ72737.1 head-to-tail stopper [Mycobacterium phage Aroostook]ASZ73102.1 head-to-tail stopper [Mycobacterium phage Gideon]ATW60238.1 head-to-tail stopper [Mycobacterium phage LouisV14]AVO22142.1 hea
MMDFQIPEPFEVTHWTRPKIGTTPAGQTKYGEPVPRKRNVRGFEPAGEQEIRTAQLAGRQVTELVMLTAHGDWPADSEVELWDGRRFEVNGPVRDYNLGPFDFEPGYAVDLRRVNDGEA